MRPLSADPSRKAALRPAGVTVFLLALVVLSLLILVLPAGPAAIAPADADASLLFPLQWLVEYLHVHARVAWGLPIPLGQILAVAAGACFLGLLWRDLAEAVGRLPASGLTLLVALNPLFLEPMLVGDTQAFALLGLYGLCRVLRRLRGDIEAFTYLRIAGLLCLMLCISMEAAMLAVALAPWLLLVAPRNVLRHAPGSFYLVCYAPFAFALAGWLYLRLVAGDAAWPLLTAFSDAALAPALFETRSFAAAWALPLRWGAAVLLGFPVLALLVLRSVTGRRSVMVALGAVLLAAIMAIALGLRLEPYLSVLWVPVALLLRGLRLRRAWIAALLLLIGIFGGALAYPRAWIASGTSFAMVDAWSVSSGTIGDVPTMRGER